ncbi:tenascin-X-like [Spea bombifrons]|uniref:tenascin-X-like n=1 Tax=Spea bombifrons TaxID=233779 RepID=UPI00234B18D8|nr:tenascin-X-like [Spea bombifrons]
MLPLLALCLFALCFRGSLPAPPSRTPADCPDSGGIRVLLKRLEILEKLVRDIKGQCSPPCCANPQTGADDPSSLKSPPCPQGLEDCPGGCGGESHGECVDGQCQCKDGYMGDRCQLKTCPEDCNDQGRCVNGRCLCFEGYYGLDCGSKDCPNDCQNQGQCENGACVCDPGFTGLDCGTRTCPNNCLNRGKCEGGLCICASGFTGVDCGSRTCPRNCLNRGRCEDGVCVCDSGFGGDDCSSRMCLNNCQGNGRCEDGVCICDAGFSGEDCSSRTCPEDCNEQGRCVSGVCVCDAGFVGADCGTRVCSEACERHGRCEDGECVCDPGYTGTDCEMKTCPDDCHNRGRCEDGECVCDSGFIGPDCGSRACPSKCSNRGRCEDGVCICNPGYSGTDCGSRACPKNCSGNGQCVNGRCVCHAGFAGPVCGTRSCPVGCNKHGRCVRGTCVCSPGYTGPDCGSKTCPRNCNNQGLCEDGVCVCNAGYSGLDCRSRTCPNDCSNQGQCDDGVCVCDYGYTGLDCGSKTCFNDCFNRGQCQDGVCICDPGYTGLDCGSMACPNDCFDRGQCQDGACVCDSGYGGLDCQYKTCPNNCNNHGQCQDGECICDSGYTGLDCGSKTCPGDCQNHGACDDGDCICDSGYTGLDCGTKTCPNDCHNRGQCADGECICDSGYEGPDCGSKTCPNDCTDRGQCVDGVCVCDSLYTGIDCGSRACPNNCQDRGRCDDGVCVCDTGYTGPDCSSRTCPDNCHVHGRCEDGACVCHSGYTGPDCSSRACPKNCNDNGQCVNGKCVCSPGFGGPVCGARTCPANCNGRGKCLNGICACKKGYEGADCGQVITEITEITEITAITGLRVTSEEETAMTVEWDDPQTPPDSYDVSFKAKKENGLIRTTVDGSLTKYRQTGLAPGEEYTVTVQPRKGQTLGPDTSITAVTKIETPRGLRVTDISTSSFVLRWDRPQSQPDRYLVTLIAPSGKERRLKVPGKGDRVRVTGLEEGTTYAVVLRAERGQQQSDGTETAAKTAVQKERKHLDVEDEIRARGPEKDSKIVSRQEKVISTEERHQSYPSSNRTSGSHGEGQEESFHTDETKDMDTENQKGSRVIHTTRTKTTIIKTYHTIYHEDGSVADVIDEGVDFDERRPQNKSTSEVVTHVVEEGDTGDDELTGTRVKIPGGKVERWIVTRNITHIGSPEDLYHHYKYPESGKDGLTETSEETPLDALSTRRMTVSSEEHGPRTHQERPSQNKDIHSNLHLPGKESSPDVEPETAVESNHDIDDTGDGDPRYGSKSRQIITTISRVVSITRRKQGNQDNEEVRNETIVHRDTDGISNRVKGMNETKTPKRPIFAGKHLRTVIENLPEKLSLFNGTFIQRLESYLRATSYPLRVNQTVETVARAIFLYLVRHKPDTFTGMVYDRLPQKTPGAKGNAEPIGASRMQGNVGLSAMEDNVVHLGNVTDDIHETSALVGKGKKTKTPMHDLLNPEMSNLGRVEALGEIDSPLPSGLRTQHSASTLKEEDGLKTRDAPEDHNGEATEDDSDTMASKNILDNTESRETHKSLPPPKKSTTAENEQEWKADEERITKPKVHGQDSDLEGRTVINVLNASVGESRVIPGIQDSSTREPDKKSEPPSNTRGIPKYNYNPDANQEENDFNPLSPLDLENRLKQRGDGPPNYESEEKLLIEDIGDHGAPKTERNLHNTLVELNQDVGQDVATEGEGERRNKHLIDGSFSGTQTNEERRSQFQEERNQESEESTVAANRNEGSVEDQSKNEPPRTPISVKVPGIVRPGRPTILQRNFTSLVISLEGLGVLWDKVMILYHPLSSTAMIIPRKVEVERGVTQVVIEGLEPGTSYRFDLHGMVKGHSSKSYSLVADTAVTPTASPADIDETTVQPTASPTQEVLTSKDPPATQRPRGPVAQMGALQVRDVTSDSVSLVWKARPWVYDSFLVRYEDVTGNTRPQETSVPGNQRDVTLRDLSQNTRYAVSVYGVRGGKLSRPLKEEVTTESSPDRGTPPRLSPISVSEVQSNSFRLSWVPLDGDFDSYLIQYGPPGGPSQEVTLNGDETSYLVTELVTGVNYTVELRGIWGEEYSKPETTSVITETPQPPRMESLSVSDVRSDSVHLTWEVQGGDFDSFLLYYRDGEGNPREVSLERDLRSFHITDLKPGKKYKFVVYGIQGEKRSKPVTAETITEKPLPPRLESFSVSDVSSDSVRLSWEVQDGDFDSFLLYYRDAEGNPKEITLEKELRTAEVDDLRPGKKYKFVLHGISGGKKGKGVIAETSTAKPSPASPSPRLTDLEAGEVGKDSVRLSWTVEGEVPFDWIVLQYREPEGGVRELQVPGGDVSALVSGLLPSRKYKFNVYGLRGEKRSKPLSTEIETGYPEVLGQPSSLLDDLYISPRGPHSILLSWEAPDGSFDSFVVRYGLQGHEELNEVSTDGSSRTLLITDLQPDSLYAVTLHGIHGEKEQGSLEATGRTGPLDLEPPRNLRFTDVEETSVVVSWDPPNAETTTFKVSYQLAEGGEPESISVVGTSTPLKGLNPGAKYEVTVVSVRGFEESQPLSSYITMVGGGPRSLRAFDISEQSALLRWEPPSGTVDSYVVTYRAENVPSITMEIPGDLTELPLSSLYSHTEYFVTIQSKIGSKTSRPSSTSFTTSVDTPSDLSAIQITARSALLTWKAPQGVPDGYQLIYHTPEGERKEIHVLPNLTSYTMTRLSPLSQYRVQLHALNGGASSAPISTSFTTGRLRFPLPRDCWEQRMNGELHSGVFTIHLGGVKEETLSVFCDMESDGGGWIVFQRRMDGSVDFYRDWNDYKRGFGNLTSEFWLGNIALHRITSLAPFELRVDLRSGDEAVHAIYDNFIVEAEKRHFRMRLGSYRGNAGDSLSYHNNMIFSTRDRDAQRRILPCAVSYHGAWWYRNCHYSNLNGQYGNYKDHQGVNWHTWKGFEFSIPFTEMKIRPRGGGNRNRL